MTSNIFKINDNLVSDRVIIREMEADELISLISTLTDQSLKDYAIFQLKTILGKI